jgi:hypothetical protein
MTPFFQQHLVYKKNIQKSSNCWRQNAGDVIKLIAKVKRVSRVSCLAPF